VLERPRLVLCKDDDLTSPFSEAFEQVSRLSFPYNAASRSEVCPS
jgi:hypothetical protein